MKKISDNIYFPVIFVCYILSWILLSEKYGFYHSLPSYHLFEMPNDTYAGNIIFHFFKWNLAFILCFLTLFLISKIFKVKIELFESIANEIKKKISAKLYVLLPIFGFPFFSLLIEYSDLIIGIENSSGSIFPVTVPSLIILLLIGYFGYNLMYKK